MYEHYSDIPDPVGNHTWEVTRETFNPNAECKTCGLGIWVDFICNYDAGYGNVGEYYDWISKYVYDGEYSDCSIKYPSTCEEHIMSEALE